MALVWKLSNTPCPQLPSPTDYSWESINGRLKPIFCLNAPAPKVLLELRKCNCKTDCKKEFMQMQENDLICTDLCECGDACNNLINL